MSTVEHEWVRLDNTRGPSTNDGIRFGWGYWQPDQAVDPWPHDLGPGFAYSVLGRTADGGLGITAKATVEYHLPPTLVASVAEAYLAVCDNLFDCHFAIEPELWLANRGNVVKSYEPWPQFVTAWRSVTEPVRPHRIGGLDRFPRSGWLRMAEVAM